MLTPEVASRAQRQINNLSAAFKESRAQGYDVQALGLPVFEAQADHDSYHPDDAGLPIDQHNEFAETIFQGLQQNGVTAKKVVIRFTEYTAWLKGRKNDSDMRAAYTGYLVASDHLTAQ